MSDDALIDRVLGSDARLLGRVLEAAAAVDRETGAPAPVRAAVGAATKAEDRLATLRRFAPDAEPHGADNFIFTHPTTRRRTLYNPPGLDLGDVASVTPEVGEMLGGAVGGFLGAPAGPVGLAGGVGLGAAAGREIATLGAQAFNGTQDTRGLGERLGDAAVTTGINAAAGPAAEGAVAAGRFLLGPVARGFGRGTGANAVQDFAQAGVTPGAGAATGNPATQGLEAAVAASPGGAGVMRQAGERQAEELGNAVGTLAERYGIPTNPGAAGATIRRGAQDAAARFETRQGELYDQAFGLVGANTPAALPSVERLGQEISAELARAPRSREAVLRPVLDSIEALADDAANGLPFDALRAVRTDLGRRIGGPPNAASAPASDTAVYLRRLYGALTDDMSAAARQAGPEAERALSLADRYTRLNRTQNLPTLEKILGDKTDEQVFRMIFPASGRPDAQALVRLRRNLQPEEWNTLAATVLDRMGLPTAGQQAGESFSAATFLTNLNRLQANGPDAFRVLFGGSQNAELASQLQRLGRVAGYIRDAARSTNWSNTARAGAWLGAGYMAGNEALEGDMGGFAKVVGLSLVAPNVAARLLTSPRFVRWLADTAPVAARTGQVGEPAWRTLARVGAADPELRSDVDALRAAVAGPR